MNENHQAGVVLKIDGEIIPLNHFVENIFHHVIQGMVDSLDKIPAHSQKIEVIIEKS
jgi:hypothetical protein